MNVKKISYHPVSIIKLKFNIMGKAYWVQHWVSRLGLLVWKSKEIFEVACEQALQSEAGRREARFGEQYRLEVRVLLNKSRTYDLPINSSDVLRLKYKRLVGDGDSGILGTNPSAPEQESNLPPSLFTGDNCPAILMGWNCQHEEFSHCELQKMECVTPHI